jgi:small subunit ribosomal protein S14
VIAARYVERRRALKAVVASPASSAEEKAGAVVALQKLPRDASPTRIRNRDTADGRPRGYLRKFGLSRVKMRQAAHNGELPGVAKSSW